MQSVTDPPSLGKGGSPWKNISSFWSKSEGPSPWSVIATLSYLASSFSLTVSSQHAQYGTKNRSAKSTSRYQIFYCLAVKFINWGNGKGLRVAISATIFRRSDLSKLLLLTHQEVREVGKGVGRERIKPLITKFTTGRYRVL